MDNAAAQNSTLTRVETTSYSPSIGQPGHLSLEARRLCAPASRRVCLFPETGAHCRDMCLTAQALRTGEGRRVNPPWPFPPHYLVVTSTPLTKCMLWRHLHITLPR